MGGGTSGAIAYPEYLENFHEGLLASVSSLAGTGSPWASQTPYDPDNRLEASDDAIEAFATMLSGIVETTDWTALYAAAVSALGSFTPVTVTNLSKGDLVSIGEVAKPDAPSSIDALSAVSDIDEVEEVDDILAINAPSAISVISGPFDILPVSDIDDLETVAAPNDITDIVAPSDISQASAPSDITDTENVVGIDDDLLAASAAAYDAALGDLVEAVTLPRFRRGMQDINAVVTSSFVIGEAIIEGMHDRDVARYVAELGLKAAEVNAPILIENQRLHLDVKKTNQTKGLRVAEINAEISKANQSKAMRVAEIGFEVDKANMSKALDVARINLELGKTNITKSVEITRVNLDVNRSNQSKGIEVDRLNLDVSKSNIGKDIDIDRLNLDISRSNQVKSLETGKINLEVARTNQSKDVEANRSALDQAKANLSAALEDNKLSVEADTASLPGSIRSAEMSFEVDKLNFEKTFRLADLNSRFGIEYRRTYLQACQDMLRILTQKISSSNDVARMTIDANRIAIVAGKEEVDKGMEIDEKDGMWPLELSSYSCHALSAIAGAATIPRGSSTLASSLGGALSGIAAGAMMGGGGWGMAAGGALGAAAGLIH
jgi:hypothetical protein